MKLGMLWVDFSTETDRIFSKTTLEDLRNKSPKIWSNNFTEINSEIGFQVTGDFLGFSRETLKTQKIFGMKHAKCWNSDIPGWTAAKQDRNSAQKTMGSRSARRNSTWPPAPVALSRGTGQIFSQEPVDYLDCLRQIQSTTLTCRLPGLFFRKPVDTFVQSTAQFLLWETSRLLPPIELPRAPETLFSRLALPSSRLLFSETHFWCFRNPFFTSTEIRVIPISV